MADQVEIGQCREAVERSGLVTEARATRIGVRVVRQSVLFDMLVTQAQIYDRLAAEKRFGEILFGLGGAAGCAGRGNDKSSNQTGAFRLVRSHSLSIFHLAAPAASHKKKRLLDELSSKQTPLSEPTFTG